MLLRLLEQAVAVERFRNMHEAARSLDLNQSTLTRGIQALEAELGAVLFNRNRGMEPTEFGLVVIARARSMLNEASAMKNEIVSLRGMAIGSLSVGCGPVISQTWIGDAVSRMAARYPGVGFQIEDHAWWRLPAALKEELVELVIGETVDMAQEPDIVVESLPRRPTVFCCRADHPLTRIVNPTIEDLAKYPLAAPKLPALFAKFLPDGQMFGSVLPGKRYFLPRINCENLAAVLRVVSQSDAVGGGILRYASPEISSGRIVALPFTAPWATTNYAIMYLRGRMLSPVADAFRAAAVSAEMEYFAEA